MSKFDLLFWKKTIPSITVHRSIGRPCRDCTVHGVVNHFEFQGPWKQHEHLQRFMLIRQIAKMTCFYGVYGPATRKLGKASPYKWRCIA